MHQNERFNIIQTFKINSNKWLVIDGQRTDSGSMARGTKIVSGELSREDAIALADYLQSQVN